ncbi:hypothetical protein ABL78_3812 [Leptomonas seymouri]|uniref:SAC3/GANP/THP3 conserved domain-containing protein n=1 Tax=Leptomonas seymouri TaxID=5684 RepID=A0A0N1IL40_LEPSE|nr:hypothetical protein ABL78_3812 [Leptomonas seymouri]|eukprot:KPI87100.1 hypothetical protein ABL78_3812 [Leptomonas seymouri]
MSRHDVLTVDFLQAHGVKVVSPLRDWLTRVSFLARSQSDEAKRERYEKWALRTVEEAVNAPGGVAAVRWAKQSAVMPSDASDQEPAWWPTGAATSSPQPSNSSRAALFEETLRRAPEELVPFVHQGFSLYDHEVARGQRTYAQVSFVEMLNIAKNLFTKVPLAQRQQLLQQQQSPKEAEFPSPSPPSYIAPPALSESTPHPRRLPKKQLASTSAESPGATAVSSSCSSTPPSTQKRSAVLSTHEPPAKRKCVAAPTGPTSQTDCSFFMQLAGTFEVETARPPVFTGRSAAMERAYTRYEPLVDDIRPLPVLKKAFAYVVHRCQEVQEAEGIKAGQKYLSDQLKGLRQDLRVQNIINAFTVSVYETHARLCLERGDIGEFNQCQAALKHFYEAPTVTPKRCHAEEFFLYRLVYLTLSEQYDSLSTELIHFTNAQMKGATRPGMEIDKEAVSKALSLCNACINGDTPTVCRLLMDFRVEMRYLVRIYLQKLRIMSLKEILTAMKGSLTMRFLMASLGFTPVVEGDSPQQPSHVFWLDGSADEAAVRLAELFKTLKVDLPANFSFEAELQRTKHTGPNPKAHFPSLDAASALKAVNDYLLYLGTRKDAGLG